MINHKSDEDNAVNHLRYMRLKLSLKRISKDGVSNVPAVIIDTKIFKTHVRLTIRSHETKMQQELEEVERRQVERRQKTQKELAEQEEKSSEQQEELSKKP